MLYDVVVAGAGPTGASAARFCAAAGLHTLLVDKKSFPRPKPCGGGLTLAAVREMELPLLTEQKAQAVHSLRSHFGSRCCEVRRPGGFMYLIDRPAFDKYLLDKAVEAGAFFCQDTILTVNQCRETVHISASRGQITAKYLIGADGIRSQVARHVRRGLTRYGQGFCLTAEVPAENFRLPPATGVIDIYYGVVPLGYGWVFPKTKTASVGIGGIWAAQKNPGAAWTAFLNMLEITCQNSLSTKGAFVPIGGIGRRVARDRVLLAGDAAGLADPFTGEGIKYALISGKLAAEAVITACHSHTGEKTAAKNYRQKLNRNINGDLGAALKLSLLFFGCAAPMHRLFYHDPVFFRELLEVFAGETDFKKYLGKVIKSMPLALIKSF